MADIPVGDGLFLRVKESFHLITPISTKPICTWPIRLPTKEQLLIFCNISARAAFFPISFLQFGL